MILSWQDHYKKITDFDINIKALKNPMKPNEKMQ